MWCGCGESLGEAHPPVSRLRRPQPGPRRAGVIVVCSGRAGAMIVAFRLAGSRVGLAQDLAAGEPVSAPQRRGPGAQQGIEEILAMFIGPVVER